MTQEELYENIINIRTKFKTNTLDAFLIFCEKNDYDVESLCTIIPQSLMADMEEDAKRLKLLKRKYLEEVSLPL